MKVNVLGMSGTVTPKQAAIGGTIAVLAAWYLLHKAKTAAVETAKAAANAVNPLNPDNVINEGFNGLYQSLTGSTGTLGADIADWLHGGGTL